MVCEPSHGTYTMAGDEVRGTEWKVSKLCSSSTAFDAQDGCNKADHLNIPQFPLVCSAGDSTNAAVCDSVRAGKHPGTPRGKGEGATHPVNNISLAATHWGRFSPPPSRIHLKSCTSLLPLQKWLSSPVLGTSMPSILMQRRLPAQVKHCTNKNIYRESAAALLFCCPGRLLALLALRSWPSAAATPRSPSPPCPAPGNDTHSSVSALNADLHWQDFLTSISWARSSNYVHEGWWHTLPVLPDFCSSFFAQKLSPRIFCNPNRKKKKKGDGRK